MATLVWTTEDITKFINCIRLNKILWKTDHPGYGKRGPRDFAMKKVSIEFPNRSEFT